MVETVTGREATPEREARERLGRVLDVLNRYDESCEDDTCECCSTWRSHVTAALNEADL